jgi:hypothetical protein
MGTLPLALFYAVAAWNRADWMIGLISAMIAAIGFVIAFVIVRES